MASCGSKAEQKKFRPGGSNNREKNAAGDAAGNSLTEYYLIAKDLAFGCSTSEVAEKHGLTAGRISQLRRVLEEWWAAFQQEAAPAMA